MNVSKLAKLPLERRIRLVEDLWDSIAAGQNGLPLTADQRIELDRRLDAYEADHDPGLAHISSSAGLKPGPAATAASRPGLLLSVQRPLGPESYGGPTRLNARREAAIEV